jgi:hypothetical protein
LIKRRPSGYRAFEGGNQGVMVVRDGTLRGDESYFLSFGTYTRTNGKWKGEVTNREHSPTFGARPVWERKIVTIGFTGTYTDETARRRRHGARGQTERLIQIEAAVADSGLRAGGGAGSIRARSRVAVRP